MGNCIKCGKELTKHMTMIMGAKPNGPYCKECGDSAYTDDGERVGDIIDKSDDGISKIEQVAFMNGYMLAKYGDIVFTWSDEKFNSECKKEIPNLIEWMKKHVKE